jgi:ComF family protein
VTPAAGGVCGRCRRGINPIVRGASLGPYEGVLRTAVHELKYRGRRRLAPRLARALADEPAVRPLLAEGALLVPVPLHARRLRARGFNQSALLARGLSARTGLRVAEVLRRRRDTTPQTGLSAARRRANVRAAFVVRRPAWVRGRTVILVDDVQTTGATALSCAHALLGAGAAEVRLVTVARA